MSSINSIISLEQRIQARSYTIGIYHQVHKQPRQLLRRNKARHFEGKEDKVLKGLSLSKETKISNEKVLQDFLLLKTIACVNQAKIEATTREKGRNNKRIMKRNTES